MKTHQRSMRALTVVAILLLACDLSTLAGVSTKPTVVIVSPPSGVRTMLGSEVEVQSVATDAQGIARVELWVDGVIVRTDTLPAPQATFSVVQRWTATSPGIHIIQVGAYSANGTPSDPAVISIEVVPAIAQATQPPLPPASQPPSAARVTPTPTSAQISGASSPPPPASPVLTAPPRRNPNPTTIVRKPATPFAPADLSFRIDCSALDPSRKPECDLYIANTRDLVYPLLRDLTGTSLSRCYDAVYYTIVPDEQLSQWMGQADKNRILYSLRATLDAAPAPLYDAHELLHTIAFCSGALDRHVFHGAIENQIDLTLTGHHWQNPGRELVANWLVTKLVPEVKRAGNATPAPGQGQGVDADLCEEIFGDLVLILHYDSGIEPIKQLYRATINPGTPAPNAQLTRLFGAQSNQFQAVVNALKQNPQYSLRVPECGY